MSVKEIQTSLVEAHQIRARRIGDPFRRYSLHSKPFTYLDYDRPPQLTGMSVFIS